MKVLHIWFAMILVSAAGCAFAMYKINDWRNQRAAHVTQWQENVNLEERILADVTEIDKAINELSGTNWGQVIEYGIKGFISGYIGDGQGVIDNMNEAKTEGERSRREADARIEELRVRRAEILERIAPQLAPLEYKLSQIKLLIEGDDAALEKWKRIRTISLWIFIPLGSLFALGWVASRRS